MPGKITAVLTTACSRRASTTTNHAITSLLKGEDGTRLKSCLPSDDQNNLSCRLRFPSAPILARAKVKRNWFSFRTEPKARRRYSRLKPQQSQLYAVCTAEYCRKPR